MVYRITPFWMSLTQGHQKCDIEKSFIFAAIFEITGHAYAIWFACKRFLVKNLVLYFQRYRN